MKISFVAKMLQMVFTLFDTIVEFAKESFMSFMKEFKEFAMRGNVVDLAVGVIIGAAFGKIVTSLVTDIIMPPLGMLLNGIDFKNLKYVLKPAIGKTPETSINYGLFIN